MTGVEGIIESAVTTIREASTQQTDGKWLENITVLTAPLIREWDVEHCYLWTEWPEREARFPSTTNQDIGIDAVAVRRSDGEHIAIQCKSRQLDEHGRGGSISKDELNKFIASSADDLWAERWLVTNGDNPMSPNIPRTPGLRKKPIKQVNITNDLLQQQTTSTSEECPHCQPNPDGEERRQTKTCMQNEAVTESVRILREHEQSDSGGLPVGQARGRIILPCGTGKTRISLRIVEELTPPGELSIILCPSIALVAQLRREYLQHAKATIRALAVCSDETAGYDPKNEGMKFVSDDPTLDTSNVSAGEVKGRVTTDPAEIARWIEQGKDGDTLNVIFGTYQSGHRIADALKQTKVRAKVLVADEAHRTAGLKRKGRARNASEEERKIKDFTLCHDSEAFPATYRVYQTATPRIYDTSKVDRTKDNGYIIRSMDDEEVFGVELYRKSYVEAVNNDWLADYRIIAVGISGPNEKDIANTLAGITQSKGRNALTTTDFLRGMAFTLVMGGATRGEEEDIRVKSSIAFMNRVDKSKNMAKDLQTDIVKNWLQDYLAQRGGERKAPDYKLEHLDASNNVSSRDSAKLKLAEATDENPHAVINVGIFGEGTDSPSLSSVAFLEARKSPVDVIQAVGRAMRTAPEKEIGYIICPIVIPENVDPEEWLSTSYKEDGWQELGQILVAMRAHDERIEEKLSELMTLYLPMPPEVETTIIIVGDDEKQRVTYGLHLGSPGEAPRAVERVLKGESKHSQEFLKLDEKFWTEPDPETGETHPEPTQIVAGKQASEGSTDIRRDAPARRKAKNDGDIGPVDVNKSKQKGLDMVNKGTGIPAPPRNRQERPKPVRPPEETNAMQMVLIKGLGEQGKAITTNLLSKSGLTGNRVVRDLNILETSVKEAAYHLERDGLRPTLNRHFMLDNLEEKAQKAIEEGKAADGCVTAALLMMNAAMLHQRIAKGGWLNGISDLKTVKNDVNVVRRVGREWERITRHDFHAVLEPAIEVIHAIEDTGRLAGLERALRHITAEAERIAETYADMGADHAGLLFNRVMGNQASDGAFFTRPVAASIAARLTLDACGPVDWSDPEVWKAHKTVDLACGSGTLLAAVLTDMKRRAREQGASEAEIAGLQRLAVEDTIKGLDINPVSLQLAASQLTTGNQEIGYRRMGLHLMPYGPQPDNPAQVSAGTLELLGQKAIVARDKELGLADDRIQSQSIWASGDADLEDAVAAAKDARIIIMNPPFSNRSKMGEKFPQETQRLLRKRVDDMERILVRNDEGLKDFVDKNALEPLFTALADKCVRGANGVLTMINPTVALCATSALNKRRIFAQRFRIHTVLTGRWPREFSLSQNAEIDESIIVATRSTGDKTPTRFVQLDKMPVDDTEVDDLHRCLLERPQGRIANGWGEVSYWPAKAMEAGDWTPAIWRSPELAEAARKYAGMTDSLQAIEGQLADHMVHATGQLLRGSFEPAGGFPGSFPIVKSKGADSQTTIQSRPDEHWIPKKRDAEVRELNGGVYPEVEQILRKSGHLLITAGHRTSSARLTATASDEKYVGNGWMPVTGLTPEEGKAVAVFLNSTSGRLQLMRHPGRQISFPTYSAAEVGNILIPNVKDTRIRQILADCWEHTKDMKVPQFRDGECEVRRLWDEAVAEAMGWDAAELSGLRHLLHQEPHVSGLGYGQYGDEVAEEQEWEPSE